MTFQTLRNHLKIMNAPCVAFGTGNRTKLIAGIILDLVSNPLPVRAIVVEE